ncbi:PX domain/Protein tyrosine kinase/Protein kinase domain [Leishmania utingensis]|uniref:PX domain/Protein tyrosine kinase/Protein kinase domain n=1 Tax=Leishmania utingensis TaxID=653362 RepID=A0AAW3AAW8_9TRYP
MSRSPLEMFYGLFLRPYTARSAPASSGSHASGDNGTSTVPVGPSELHNDNASPGAFGLDGVVGATALQHSNDTAVPAAAHGGDRRAFEGEERLLEHPHAPRQYPLDPGKDADVLVLLAQQYSITSVVITHYRVKENYVEYVIECVRGHYAWRVYRRYQQFKALDHDLKQLCSSRHGSSHGAYGVVPVLPGSHWMDVTNQSPELVEQRRRYLEIYLQQLLVPKNLFYVARTQLYDFLHDGEVPTHLRLTGIQPLLGLMSTCTDLVSDEGDNEANCHEQQEPTSVTEGAVAAVSGTGEDSALPLPTSDSTFPALPADCESPTRVTSGASSPEAPGNAKGEVSSRRALDATAVATSSIPGHTVALAPSRGPSTLLTTSEACTDVRKTSVAAVDDADDDGEANSLKGQSENAHDTNEVMLVEQSLHSLACGAAFMGAYTTPVSFADERLPPASANCAQCNAEFTSFLYPCRCFFCLVQFCSACLQKLAVLESASATAADRINSVRDSVPEKAPSSADAKGAGSGVPACRQCAENYIRRLDRCGTAPGSGFYRGMQSTFGTPAQSGSPVPPGRLSQLSLAAGSSLTINTRSCVGEESGQVMQQQRVINSTSPIPHSSLLSPRGSLVSRSDNLSPVGLQDFQLLTVIGRGTFGKVLKVQLRATHKVYAMKIMNKATVYRRCMTSYMKEEKTILTSMHPNPYIVRCHYAFQTEYYLVLVMDYLPGGELYDYIYPTLRLSPEAARIYAAELVLALECLHRQDVVHRDLKPENVVLTADGHICLTDFGLARRSFSHSRRRSFVGSPEYVAPEMIQGEVQTAAVDWWSFGVMLYEMLAGRTPFHARNNNTVYDNVLHKELELPVLRADDSAGAAVATASQPAVAEGSPTFRGFSPDAASLLTGLLARDPSMRLQDASAIKQHPFFRGVNWEDLWHRRMPAPCIPGDMRDNDVRHFKREFVSEWASVPPLTNMTRASIEALTKCFNNFPLSRTAAPAGSALVESTSTISTSPASGTPLPATHSPQQLYRGARVSSPSLALPLSVLVTDSRMAREPVRFFHSMTEAQRHFHGVWRVVSIEVHAVDDGRVIFPWGGNVSGILVYTSDSRFSLQLTPSTRLPIGPVQRVTQLSKEDLCDTYCSYVAVFGHFHLAPSSMDDGCGVVQHFAEGHLCPNLMFVNTIFEYRTDTEPLYPSAITNESKNKGGSKPTGATSSAATTAASACTSSMTGAEDGSGGGSRGQVSDGGSLSGSEGERGKGEKSGEKTTVFGYADQQHDEGSASTTGRPQPSPPVPERRILLRLSTRPQRVPEHDFLAFTSLVFEKVP